MAQVQGTFQGFLVAQEGTGKRGPWKRYQIIVDGKKWSFGFDPPKAAVNDLVTFNTVTNEKGYEDVEAKTFKVVSVGGGASTAQSGPTANSNAVCNPANDPKQRSIEAQSSIASASRIVAAQINAGVTIASPAQAVASLVDAFLGILHPKPKAAPKPKSAERAYTESGDFPQSAEDRADGQEDVPY